MKACDKQGGCPPGIDLRNCKDFPHDCPFARIVGDSLIIERRQLKLFDNDIESS